MKTDQCNYLISGSDSGQMMVTLENGDNLDAKYANMLKRSQLVVVGEVGGDNPFPLPTPHPCM